MKYGYGSDCQIEIERQGDRRGIGYQPASHREEPKLRAVAHTLALIGLLGLVAHATPSAALVIGGGWTADEPAGVTYPGAVTGAGTMADAWKFTLKLSSPVGTSTTIKFTNDGTSSDSFFNLTFEGMNTGASGSWTGLSIVIVDTTEDPIVDEPIGTGHPIRAHVHRNSWDDTQSSHFKCVDPSCPSFGLYDMTLGLKSGANPITPGNSTNGKTLRLHDQDEEGTKPMRFELTLTPLPEPGTILLLSTGLAAAAVVSRRRRNRPA
jgi:hypothetical protein